MKILWTHNFDPTVRSSGVFMHLLAQGMRDIGVELELCYLGNLRSVTNMLQAYYMVKEIATDFDLVHSQFGSACAVATCGAKNVPKVLSLRGSDWYRFSGQPGFQSIHGMLASTMTRMVVRNFSAVVAMSRRMTDGILKEYPDLVVSSIPSPIHLKNFQPVARSVARAKLGCPDNTDKWILFTTLSERNPVKRVQLAQAAVRIANERLGCIKLRIATGLSHSEMPMFVSACDLALCTSVHEGWPNCIKEALACNLPFIATDVSDLSTIASQEPSCRICLPDPDILADNICDVLSMPRAENLSRHVYEMDVPVISKRLYDLYKEIVR